MVREYHEGDLETLYRIDSACFPKGICFSRQELHFYINLSRAFTYVAAPSLTAAAIGFILVLKEARAWGHIITLDLLPAYRRQQLGSRLLTRGETQLWQVGVTQIYLETAIDNQAAQRLFIKHGYRCKGRLPGYYQQKLDAYRMFKSLVDPAGQAGPLYEAE